MSDVIEAGAAGGVCESLIGDGRRFAVPAGLLGAGSGKADLAAAVSKARKDPGFAEEAASEIPFESLVAGFSSIRSRAGELLAGLVKSGERVAVFGDYDVDGISSCAVMTAGLAAARLGAEAVFGIWRHQGLDLAAEAASVLPIVPERSDGYGISKNWIRRFEAGGLRQIVCCDNGTNALAAMTAAVSSGVRCVVLDHHPASVESAAFWNGAPAGFAISNPWMEGGIGDFVRSWPGEVEVCAATVAFATVLEVLDRLGGRQNADFIARLGVLAGVASVTDVMPLRAGNRTMVRNALWALDDGKAPSGLVAIRDAVFAKRGVEVKAAGAPASLWDCALDASFFGYQIGPRLNACGRMGEAETALKLIGASDGCADEFAAGVDALNAQRREIETVCVENAARVCGSAMERASSGGELDVLELASFAAKRRLGRGFLSGMFGFSSEGEEGGFGRIACAYPGLFVVYVDKELASGVAGLVAARLAETFDCPAIAVGGPSLGHGALWSGSGRCPETSLWRAAGIDVSLAASSAAALCGGGGGGHAAAFGLRLPAASAEADAKLLVGRFAVDMALQLCTKLGEALAAGTVSIEEGEPGVEAVDLALADCSALAAVAKPLVELGPFGRSFQEPSVYVPFGRSRVRQLGSSKSFAIEPEGSEKLKVVGFESRLAGGLENPSVVQALARIEAGEAGLIGKLHGSFYGRGRYGRNHSSWKGPVPEFQIEAIVTKAGE